MLTASRPQSVAACPMSNESYNPVVAWIASGKLYVRRQDGTVDEIESDFARSSLEREARHAQAHAWKGRSGVWGEMGIQPPGAAPWDAQESRRTIRFMAIARGDSPNEIYYILDLGPVGGLFMYDLESEEETRLMHSQGFIATDLSRHPEDGRIAVALPRDDGTIGLSVTRNDGLFPQAISISDSSNEAPCWLRDGSARNVFQSSAVGRNENGFAVGNSSYRIEQLDLDDEKIESLLEEDNYDLIAPKATDDGTLLFIRRPHKVTHAQKQSIGETLKDALLFPFRLIRMFIYLFNFMSKAFTGKPLMRAGVPENEVRRSPFLMLYGQAVDTRLAMKKRAGNHGTGPLVPKEWELVRRSPDGGQTILATNVLSFDVSPGGSVIYTDGSSVFHVNDSAQQDKVTAGNMIERVLVLKD